MTRIIFKSFLSFGVIFPGIGGAEYRLGLHLWLVFLKTEATWLSVELTAEGILSLCFLSFGEVALEEHIEVGVALLEVMSSRPSSTPDEEDGSGSTFRGEHPGGDKRLGFGSVTIFILSSVSSVPLSMVDDFSVEKEGAVELVANAESSVELLLHFLRSLTLP